MCVCDATSSADKIRQMPVTDCPKLLDSDAELDDLSCRRSSMEDEELF